MVALKIARDELNTINLCENHRINDWWAIIKSNEICFTPAMKSLSSFYIQFFSFFLEIYIFVFRVDAVVEQRFVIAIELMRSTVFKWRANCNHFQPFYMRAIQ